MVLRKSRRLWLKWLTLMVMTIDNDYLIHYFRYRSTSAPEPTKTRLTTYSTWTGQWVPKPRMTWPGYHNLEFVGEPRKTKYFPAKQPHK